MTAGKAPGPGRDLPIRIAQDVGEVEGALPVPPDHEAGAEALLRLEGDLQHGGGAVAAHWQEPAAVRDDRLAIGNEAPAAKINVEHDRRVRLSTAPGSLARQGMLPRHL